MLTNEICVDAASFGIGVLLVPVANTKRLMARAFAGEGSALPESAKRANEQMPRYFYKIVIPYTGGNGTRQMVPTKNRRALTDDW